MNVWFGLVLWLALSARAMIGILMIEDRLLDALSAAGDILVEAVRARLAEQGHNNSVHVVLRDDRVTVISRDRLVRDAEMGTAGVPPTGQVEMAARDAAASAVLAFKMHLDGAKF
jgi:hypothetical protein